jgi:hypothetical protein
MLTVAAQPAVILPAAEMLHLNLGRWLSDHCAENTHSFDDRLADLHFGAIRIEQYAPEFKPRTDRRLAMIDANPVSLADPILP